MIAPDWQSLRVVLNERAAIYAEHFPGLLGAGATEVAERFTHDVALDLLYTFAGAWPTLGRDVGDQATRFVYLVVGGEICRFRGIELAPGAIVVDDIQVL